MNYHNIVHDDMLNGQGLRVTLFVSGCTHHCPNCQNPQTHDFNSGIEFDKNAYEEIKAELDKDYVRGITLSGGDPLAVCNRETITELARTLKDLYPNKTIWCYSGFTYEDIKDLEIMEYIDVLVDGRFIEALKDNNLHWKGSSNQRVIDVPKTRELGEIVLTD